MAIESISGLLDVTLINITLIISLTIIEFLIITSTILFCFGLGFGPHTVFSGLTRDHSWQGSSDHMLCWVSNPNTKCLTYCSTSLALKIDIYNVSYKLKDLYIWDIIQVVINKQNIYFFCSSYLSFSKSLRLK